MTGARAAPAPAAVTAAPSPSRRRPRPPVVAVPVAVIAVWAAAVTVSGSWGRVADGAVAALTMVFGSLVAGATPQGGGAVAFPVFTKVLEVPAAAARTFSLSIQTVGMGTAAVLIVVRRLPVAWRAVRVAAPAAGASFLGSVAGLTDDGPYLPSVVPDDVVKLAFTVVVASLAVLMVSIRRTPLPHQDVVPGAGSTGVLVVAGVLGGVASAMLGSGADVVVFLALTLWFGVRPSVAVPTSVVLMAIVSAVGLVRLGLVDGQLLAADGGVDLPALWLAAAPVVAIGAPVGSWLASKATDRVLLGVVITLAGVEVLSTVLFLERVRTDPRLTALAVAAGAVVVQALRSAHRRRFPELHLSDRPLAAPAVGPALAWVAPTPSPRRRDAVARGHRPNRPRPEGADMAHQERPTAPIVTGVRSRSGQLNHPQARYCHRSGHRLDGPVGPAATGPRPHLGVLCADDGSSHPLGRDLLVGRDPSRHHLVGEGLAVPLVLDDESGALSRAHLLVTLRGWDIRAADLGSSNGTWLQAPGGGPWTRLPVGEAVTLASGAVLACGGRQLRIDHLHVR
ncbi:MAG: TSUP family transporter [Microthrixaceae bacterium]|nr:TSUP family transporter [Microthrixaceae bacterium]